MPTHDEEPWVLAGEEQTPTPNGADKPPAQADEAPPADETPSPFDELAQDMGWKPLKDWKGPQDTWVPAKEYIRTTHQKYQAVSERARDLDRRSRRDAQALEDYQARLDRLERATNHMMSEQERRHRVELESYYEAEKKAAAKAGDDALYDKLDAEKRAQEAELDRRFQKEPEVNYQRQAEEMLSHPVVGKFLRDNSWIVHDEEAYEYAVAVADEYAQAGFPVSAQVKAANEMLRQAYPQYYDQRGKPTRTAPVEGDEGDAPPDMATPAPRREAPVQDPETGRFVPQRDAHLYQQPRRAPPQVQAGSRMPSSARMSPEQQAWNELPAEARSVYKAQKESGAFKGDIVRFAKIYRGEKIDVI